MKAAPGKERDKEPVENREEEITAEKPQPEDYSTEWGPPGSIEQFEKRSREDIAGFE
jgi:hypothetical protein